MLGITRKRKEIKRKTTVQPLPGSFYRPQPEYKKRTEPKWKPPEKGKGEARQQGPASARGGPRRAQCSARARRGGSGAAAWGWCWVLPLPGLRSGITKCTGAWLRVSVTGSISPTGSFLHLFQQPLLATVGDRTPETCQVVQQGSEPFVCFINFSQSWY